MYACVMHLSLRSLGVTVAVVLLSAALAACGASGNGSAGGAGSAAGGVSGAGTPSASAAAGRPMAVVPQLVGRRQEDAHRIAARHGLKLRWMGFVGKLGNGRYNVPCVKVHSQSPVAGEQRPRGARIAVTEAACQTPHGRPHVL